jgi:hypothetical protein
MVEIRKVLVEGCLVPLSKLNDFAGQALPPDQQPKIFFPKKGGVGYLVDTERVSAPNVSTSDSQSNTT